VIHRNDGTLATASSVTSRNSSIKEESSCDVDDPIRAHRVQPAYIDAASSVPGAEVVRVPQSRNRKLTVDSTRSGLMNKINKNQILAAAERVAKSPEDSQRRQRISRGEPPDRNGPDERTRLLEDYDERIQYLPLYFSRPDHVLPASFFTVVIPGFGMAQGDENTADSEGKCSSLVTIVSIWNTMMGTSLLSIPWAVGKSGLAGALIIGIAMALISCFTAIEIVEVHTALDTIADPIPEFAQLCGKLLGRRWEVAAGVASLGAITGAVIVYWVLMSNFLFLTVNWAEEKSAGTLPAPTNASTLLCPKNNSVPRVEEPRLDPNQTLLILEATEGNFLDHFDHQDMDRDHDEFAPEDFVLGGVAENNKVPDTFSRIWNRKTVPLYLLILFPVICMRSVTFFAKFNCLGSISVGFILFMICYWCGKWGINADFSDPTSPQFVPLFVGSFPSLSGMLALGLFIHNAIITLCRNNRHQENNKRDVSIAFVLVIVTYLFVGVVFYISFPLPKFCIEDNIYNNFALFDGVVVAARALLLLQLVTVFPLLMYLIRVQFLILIRLPESLVNIVLVNATVCTACVLFTVFMPSVGTIIRYSGAFCGFCMIFTLPGLVKMTHLKNGDRLTWRHIALYSTIILLGLSNLIAQFLFK